MITQFLITLIMLTIEWYILDKLKERKDKKTKKQSFFVVNKR